MSAALIGLIGVIAGALLGGIVNNAVEKRKRWATAKAAGHLIEVELRAVVGRIDSTLATRNWWGPELPTREWHTNARELAVELPDLLPKIAAAYRTVEIWNTDPQADPPPMDELKEDRKAIDRVREELSETLEAPPGRLLRGTFRIGALVVGLVVAALIALALLCPRPYLTDQTVATSLEQGPVGERVDCDSANGDWRCTTLLTGPRPSCPASRPGARAGQTADIQLAAGGELAADRSCEVKTYDVSRDGDNLVITSAQAEREANRRAMLAPIEKESLVTQGWDAVTGKTK